MRRALAFAVLLAPLAAFAQEPAHQHHHPMAGAGNGMPMNTPMAGAPMSGMGAGGMPMNHMQMMHGGGMPGAGMAAPADVPTQPGQAAFAAIQEIVQILEADPRTDWSKVDIEALRQHLIDMNNVTLSARVKDEPLDGGLRFVVSGDGAVRDSIRRMVTAHAATMDGVGGWHFAASPTDDGAILDVRVPAADAVELKALGFIGVMTRGMHHQEHHLMIARGEHPHQ